MNAIEIAIKMETDAIDFYKSAAEKANHPAGKKMFLTIAGDEKRHLTALSDFLKGLDIKTGDVSPMQNIKTIFASMKDKMMDKISASSDELEAFKIAMQMEKDGIVFYEKVFAETKNEKERRLFEWLVKEEKEHYDIFSNTYSFLSDTGNWFMWEEHSIVDGGTPWA